MASKSPSASLLSPTDKPPAFVRNLARLPPSMTDQVLNDLPIIRVLQILYYGTQALKDSVFNHGHYHQLFLSPADAAPVLDLFRLYRDVCWFRRLPLNNNASFLSGIYRHVPRAWNNQTDFLRKVETHLKVPVVTELRLGDLDEAILSAHSSTACPKLDENSLSALKARWEWIKQHKLVLNAAKAKQLHNVADMIAEYPGRVRLKKPLDPSQKGPRPNTEHIVNHFRGAAGRVLKDRNINRHTSHCSKAVENIEVIPYDKYLWLFLDTLKVYPPANEELEIEGLLKKIALDNTSVVNTPKVELSHSSTQSVAKAASTSTSSAKSTHSNLQPLLPKNFQYPEEIAAAIISVMKGLVNVYTGSPLLLVPRIDWNPPASASSDPTKPIFFVDTKPHPPNLPRILHRCPARKVIPYDEQEYEWLRAFLKVVTWMEDNLSDKSDNKVMTVS